MQIAAGEAPRRGCAEEEEVILGNMGEGREKVVRKLGLGGPKERLFSRGERVWGTKEVEKDGDKSRQ